MIETLLPRLSRADRPVVLVDGRSGSGKSTFATALEAAWPEAQLVRLDDLYPGWDGLEAASRLVAGQVLAPVDPSWNRWDWTRNEQAERHVVDANRPLVIEGSGVLSRANRALATFGIWFELDAATRRERALARDGDAYALEWDRWSRQEEAFVRRERPDLLADLVIDQRAS